MKLFTAKNKQPARKAELLKPNDVAIKQTLHVSQTLLQGTKQLNKFRDDEQNERLLVLAEFNRFLADINAQRSSLLQEIASLREQHRKELEPVESRLAEVALAEQELNHRQRELEAQETSLAAGRAEQAERTRQLTTHEQDVAERTHSLEQQERRLADRQDGLAKEKAQWTRQAAERDTLQAEQAEQLRLRELRVKGQEVGLEAMKESLDKQQTELDNYKIKLADERLALDAAWQELRSKQHNNGSSSQGRK